MDILENTTYINCRSNRNPENLSEDLVLDQEETFFVNGPLSLGDGNFFDDQREIFLS